MSVCLGGWQKRVSTIPGVCDRETDRQRDRMTDSQTDSMEGETERDEDKLLSYFRNQSSQKII